MNTRKEKISHCIVSLLLIKNKYWLSLHILSYPIILSIIIKKYIQYCPHFMP